MQYACLKKAKEKKQLTPTPKSKKKPQTKKSQLRLAEKIKNFGLNYKIDPKLKFKRKGSELILEYGRDFIQLCNSDAEIEKTVSILILCWNTGCLESNEREEETLKIIKALNFHNIEDIIQTLIKRKVDVYYEYRYHIVEYDLSIKGDDIHLNVASKELD